MTMTAGMECQSQSYMMRVSVQVIDPVWLSDPEYGNESVPWKGWQGWGGHQSQRAA